MLESQDVLAIRLKKAFSKRNVLWVPECPKTTLGGRCSAMKKE
jgi:hypothetical protein